MNNKFEKRFEKWEVKKRNEMGDIEFLKKYINMYKTLDKLNKYSFLIITLACTLMAIWRIVIAFVSPILNNIMFAFVSFILAMTWIIFTQMYFLYISYGMCGRHISKWETEQKKVCDKTDVGRS